METGLHLFSLNRSSKKTNRDCSTPTPSREVYRGIAILGLLTLGAWVVGCVSLPVPEELCIGEEAEERLWALEEDPATVQEFLSVVESCAEGGLAEYQFLWGSLLLSEAERISGEPILGQDIGRHDALVWVARAAEQELASALEYWSGVFANGWFETKKDPEAAKACLQVENPQSVELCLSRIKKLLKEVEKRDRANRR